MLSFQSKPASSSPPPSAPQLETDQVKIIARAMVELQAQGRIVDKETLVAYGRFTRAEVDEHGEAAADLATMMTREAA